VISVGDELEVETWPSGIERSVALRDFRISRQGRVVGQATSLWFVLDMVTRLPLRPHKILPEHLHERTEHLIVLPKLVPPLPEPVTRQRRFDVRQADIDLNQHVTAASYVAWAMEAVPEELWRSQRLATIDIQFLEECHLGSRILSQAHLSDPHAVTHRITRESDGKELARLTSSWLTR
jgi:acyl-ACP thioesterase